FRSTALQCLQGNLEIVRRLLHAGMLIESKDKAMLEPYQYYIAPQLDAAVVHWACQGGSLPILELLLHHCSNLDARDKVTGTSPATLCVRDLSAAIS
ncbi:hypothetical protein P4O66_010772, partial [Electrophorus voltai]